MIKKTFKLTSAKILFQREKKAPDDIIELIRHYDNMHSVSIHWNDSFMVIHRINDSSLLEQNLVVITTDHREQVRRRVPMEGWLL